MVDIIKNLPFSWRSWFSFRLNPRAEKIETQITRMCKKKAMFIQTKHILISFINFSYYQIIPITHIIFLDKCLIIGVLPSQYHINVLDNICWCDFPINHINCCNNIICGEPSLLNVPPRELTQMFTVCDEASISFLLQNLTVEADRWIRERYKSLSQCQHS